MDTSEFKKEILLAKDDLDSLWKVAVKYRDLGMDKGTMYSQLGEIILDLRAHGEEATEDRITDLSDYVIGYCIPEQRLFKDIE